MDRWLIIVSRTRPELWSDLRQRYGSNEELEIILDRREDQSTAGLVLGRRRSKVRMEPISFIVVPQPFEWADAA